MKYAIFLLILLPLITLSGCDKDQNGNDWDISPVTFFIHVVDAEGNDLLNPQTKNGLDANKIKAVYKEKEYECNQDASQPPTKAYMPYFYGLKSFQSNQSGLYFLFFGELEGDKSYTNEVIKIVWEDGSSDKISFNRDCKWGKNGDPKITQEWFLNDTKVTSGTFKIIK